MKKKFVTLTAIGVLLGIAAICAADVNYDFVKQQGEVEQKIGPMVKQVCNTIIGVGLGVSIIGIGIGGCQWFGRVFKMDKEVGMERVKAGLIGILVFGVFWAIIASAFKIAGL